MTTFDTNRSPATAVAFGTMFVTLFGTTRSWTETRVARRSILGMLRTWNDARVTRKSLNKLTARELDDIGLCRGDIDTIAARGGRF